MDESVYTKGVLHEYHCGECNYQTKQHAHLTNHFQSKHVHTQSKHGIKYGCNQCDYKATQKKEFENS